MCSTRNVDGLVYETMSKRNMMGLGLGLPRMP